MKKIIYTTFILLLALLIPTACVSDKKIEHKEPEMKLEDIVDFILEIEEDREIRILQLTDTQIIDAGQCRTEDRLNSTAKQRWATNTIESNCFNYIRDTIEMTNPDLILITGDIIYGEFDDTGESLLKLTRFMDSFKIPWAPIFGNHENESTKGVDWQCEVLENAEYSFFKRGNVTGNSNYTIGIVQNDDLKRIIYMMDSNGCSNTNDPSVKKTVGFAEDQLAWFEETAEKAEQFAGDKVKSFVGYHIPTIEFGQAAVAAGYQESPTQTKSYVIGKHVEAKNGDFGKKSEPFEGMHEVPGLLDMFKEHGVDGVFVGHCHQISTSVLYEGIRWTFGLKTGTYDSHDTKYVGGTYIEVKTDNSFTVEHKHVDIYKIEPDTYQHIYMD